MQDLVVSLVQTSLIWEDIEANLAKFDELLSGLKGKTDLIILPEMFSTGFTMNAAFVTGPMNGSAIKWMEKNAHELGAVITGSIIIAENGHFYNRLIWMRPDGHFLQYDKRHLFSMAGEDKVFTKGKEKLSIQYKGWKICPMICYDLRFPVWTRNAEHYDLLLFVANWPTKRIAHWNSLIPSRAIENQCYVVGVNRVGEDGNGIPYNGNSLIADSMGEILFQNEGETVVYTTTLSHEHLLTTRRHMPFLKDMDDFSIIF